MVPAVVPRAHERVLGREIRRSADVLAAPGGSGGAVAPPGRPGCRRQGTAGNRVAPGAQAPAARGRLGTRTRPGRAAGDSCAPTTLGRLDTRACAGRSGALILKPKPAPWMPARTWAPWGFDVAGADNFLPRPHLRGRVGPLPRRRRPTSSSVAPAPRAMELRRPGRGQCPNMPGPDGARREVRRALAPVAGPLPAPEAGRAVALAAGSAARSLASDPGPRRLLSGVSGGSRPPVASRVARGAAHAPWPPGRGRLARNAGPVS